MDLPELTPRVVTVLALEGVLYLAGLVVLITGWRRSRASTSAAVRGEIGTLTLPLSDLLLAAFAVVVGALLLQSAVGGLARALPHALTSDAWLVAQGCGFQLGLLSGALLGHRLTSVNRREAPAPSASAAVSTRSAIGRGALLFLASLPLVFVAAMAWQAGLHAAGFPTDQQEMVDLVRNADSPALVLLIALLAVVLAPVAEELVFRAGLFRYLRTRVPRSVALTAPSLLFAALHGNAVAFAPLAVLGVLLSLAYERSGRLLVPIVAHALFNLHTLALVLSGVDL